MAEQYSGNSYSGAGSGGGGGGGGDVTNNITNITRIIESFPFVFIDTSLSIDAANLATYRGKSIIYAEATNGAAAINLPAADATTSYPLIFGFEHLGGTTRTDTNLLSIRAHGVETIDEGGVQITTAIALERGDVAYIERTSATSAWEISRVSASAGADGPQGPRGLPGTDGASITGPRGIPGTDGASITGPRGIPGADGASITGPRGISGTDGTDGVGIQGVPGVKGDKGDQGIPGTGTGTGTSLPKKDTDFLEQIAQSPDNNRPDVDAAIEETRWYNVDSQPRTVAALPTPIAGRLITTTTQQNRLLLVGLPITQETATIHVNVENAQTDEIAAHVSFNSVFTPYDAIIAPTAGYKYFIYGPSTLNPTRVILAPNIAYELFASTTGKKYTGSDEIDFTSTIKNLPVSSLDQQGKLAIGTALAEKGNDITILEGMEVTSTTSDLLDQAAFFWKFGEPSFDTSAYSLFSQDRNNSRVGLPALSHAADITFLVPYGSTDVHVVAAGGPLNRLVVALAGQVILSDADGNRSAWDAYTTTLPANVPVPSIVYYIGGTSATHHLSGAASSFKVGIDNLSVDLRTLIEHEDPANLVLTQWGEKLTAGDVTTGASTWTLIDPPPITPTVVNIASGYWREDRRTNTKNFYGNSDDVTITGARGNTEFYNAANGEVSPWLGHDSFIFGAPFTMANGTGSTALTNAFPKIYSLDYQITRRLATGRHDLVKLGTGEPLIVIDPAVGLAVRVKRGGASTQHTRTFNDYIPVSPGFVSGAGAMGTGINADINGEFEVIIPDDETGQYIFTFRATRIENGNNEGSATQALTVPNVTADSATLGNFTLTFSDGATQAFTTEYKRAFPIQGITRRVVFVRLTINNRAVGYSAQAYVSATESFSLPTSVASQTINAGSAFDADGIFNVDAYHTLSVGYTNRVMFLFELERFGDTSADPVMALKVIVDGQSMPRINLNRQASEFDFRVGIFGSDAAASFSHLQVAGYDDEYQITQAQLATLYHGHSADPAYGSLGYGVTKPPHLTNIKSFDLDGDLRIPDDNGNFVSLKEVVSNQQHFALARNSNLPPHETVMQPIQNGGAGFGRTGWFTKVTMTLLTSGVIAAGATARFGYVKSNSNTEGLTINDVIAGTEFDVPLLGLHTVFPKAYTKSQATFTPLDRVDFILISSTHTIRVGTISWLLNFVND